MDDTWVIQQQSSKQTFLDHINSIDPTVKFTAEGTQGNGAIPFLDILITPQTDNSLSISVYHKPTHTDQYLQWDSHHCLAAKYSVIGTLTHRAKTIKQALMEPKDQDPMDKESRFIYSYQCNHIACDGEYIGETARTLGERCKEHLRHPSPIQAHIQQTGHTITDISFNIIGREDWGQARTIKESIYIRVNNPTLNQNIGKYNLSHIWDRVLFNTSGLKLGSSQQTSA